MSLNPTKVFHGFWRSNGVSLPKGPVLTLNNSESKLFISAIAFLVSWAVSRFYRVFGATIFQRIFKQTESSFDNTMAVVMIVNIQSPWDGFTATIGRFWRTKAFLSIFLVSLCALLLAPAIVIWLSFLPSYREGLLLPNHCGLTPVATDKLLFTAYNSRRMQWADAAFRDVDENVTDTDSSINIKETRPAALPKPSQSYALECPPGASVCTVTYPFTFASNYTLYSKHFGLDTDTPFSLQVSDTCYRPRGASAQLPINIPGNPKQYGLFYGPLNFSSVTAGGQSNFVGTPYTEALYEGQEFRPGYRLTQYAARVDDLFDGDWTPNSTLVLGGDTTILFYYIGGVAMVKPSSDPLFATEPSITIVTPTQNYYRSAIVAPIVCDTKYRFCLNNSRNCSSLGGISNLITWLVSAGQPDLSSLFAASLFRPPIYLASLGSASIAASQTAVGQIQLAADMATARRELERLVQAGMVMLASYVRLSASGYWNLGLGSQSLTPTTSARLCDSVIIETKDYISIPLGPYIALLVVTAIIVVISYADWYLDKLEWWSIHSNNWVVHKPGPMMKRLTEVIYAKELDGAQTDKWALAEPGTLGPDLIERNGIKRFDLASRIISKSAELSAGETLSQRNASSPADININSNQTNGHSSGDSTAQQP